MTEDKSKKYGSAPRQMFAPLTQSERTARGAALSDARKREEAGKTIDCAEAAAKPLAKPKKPKTPKKRTKDQAARSKPESVISEPAPRRKRAPGGGRKNIIGDAWLQFDPPMSPAAWYRQGRPQPPKVSK